jgi:ribosomal protein S25
MNLLWIRPVEAEQALRPDERRVRDYVDSPAGVSESVVSLADKLGINRGRCRRILERLVEQGVVQRHDFSDIQPIYVRFPSR